MHVNVIDPISLSLGLQSFSARCLLNYKSLGYYNFHIYKRAVILLVPANHYTLHFNICGMPNEP